MPIAIASSSTPTMIASACGWSAQKAISKAGRSGIRGSGGSSPWVIA